MRTYPHSFNPLVISSYILRPKIVGEIGCKTFRLCQVFTNFDLSQNHKTTLNTMNDYEKEIFQWLGACVLLSSKYDLSVANHVHRQTLFIHQSSFPFSCIFCIYSIPLYAKISKETFLICTELFAT